MRLKVLASKNSPGESYIKLLNGGSVPHCGSRAGRRDRPQAQSRSSPWRRGHHAAGDRFRPAQIHPCTAGAGSELHHAADVAHHRSAAGRQAHHDRSTLQRSLQLRSGLDLPVAACHGGLYLFAGGSATPDDQDGDGVDGADPVVFLPLAYDGVNPVVTTSIPFVEAGNYTVAATCDFDHDAADANDYRASALAGEAGYQTMRWTTRTAVAIGANATTTLAFP